MASQRRSDISRPCIPRKLMDEWHRWAAGARWPADIRVALFAFMNMPVEKRFEWYYCFEAWFESDDPTACAVDELPEHDNPDYDRMERDEATGFDRRLAMMLNADDEYVEERHRDMIMHGLCQKLSQRSVHHLFHLLQAMIARDAPSDETPRLRLVGQA